MKIKRRKEKSKKSIKQSTKSLATDVKILAIDPASELGWAISRTEYGVWDLKTRKDESMGMKLLRLDAKLKEINELVKPTIIACERPANVHAGAVIHESKLIGKIEEFCAANGIEFMPLAVTSIKKFATDKGNAGKPLMIQAAQEKLGYPGNNNNEADALWILELAKHELNL